MKKNFLGMMKTLVWTLFVMIVVSASDCYVPIDEESENHPMKRMRQKTLEINERKISDMKILKDPTQITESDTQSYNG